MYRIGQVYILICEGHTYHSSSEMCPSLCSLYLEALINPKQGDLPRLLVAPIAKTWSHAGWDNEVLN